jgi:hypothetical protein
VNYNHELFVNLSQLSAALITRAQDIFDGFNSHPERDFVSSLSSAREDDFQSKIIKRCLTSEIRNNSGFRWLSKHDSLVQCDALFDVAKRHDWPDVKACVKYLIVLQQIAAHAAEALRWGHDDIRSFSAEETRRIREIAQTLRDCLADGYWHDHNSEAVELGILLTQLQSYSEDRRRDYGGQDSGETRILKKLAFSLATLEFDSQEQIVGIIELFADAIDVSRSHRTIQRYVSGYFPTG